MTLTAEQRAMLGALRMGPLTIAKVTAQTGGSPVEFGDLLWRGLVDSSPVRTVSATSWPIEFHLTDAGLAALIGGAP
jgi:hypothetical protein